MLNLDYEIRVAKITEPVSVWFYGDCHFGATGCSESEMQKTLDAVKADPNSYLVCMGDYCDFINISDKRFDLKQVAERFRDKLDNLAEAQADAFIEMHRPLRDKIICMIPGNHDELIRMKYHRAIAGHIAASLGAPFLDVVAQLRIRVTDGTHKYMVKGTISHAEKNATTVGGKITTTGRMADYYGRDDFFAQGHTHEYATVDGRNLGVRGRFKHLGNPQTEERARIVFLTGGYLKTYSENGASYGEKRGYRPCRLGSPRLVMRMRRTSSQDGRSTDFVELHGI